MSPQELQDLQDPEEMRVALREALAYAAQIREAAQLLICAWVERRGDDAVHTPIGKTLVAGHRHVAVQRALNMLHASLTMDDARRWLDRMWRLEAVALAARRMAGRHKYDRDAPDITANLREFEKHHGELRNPSSGGSSPQQPPHQAA